MPAILFRDAPSLDAAIDDALVGLHDEDRAEARTPTDVHWLGIGMRLGLERPDEARQLLAMIDAAASTPAVEPPVDSTAVPVRSALLARDAAVPFAERASIGPNAMFGWAAMLTRGEVQLLGRVVHEMLATGALGRPRPGLRPRVGRRRPAAAPRARPALPGVHRARDDRRQRPRRARPEARAVAWIGSWWPARAADPSRASGRRAGRGGAREQRRAGQARPGRHLERVDGDALPGDHPAADVRAARPVPG